MTTMIPTAPITYTSRANRSGDWVAVESTSFLSAASIPEGSTGYAAPGTVVRMLLNPNRLGGRIGRVDSPYRGMAAVLSDGVKAIPEPGDNLVVSDRTPGMLLNFFSAILYTTTVSGDKSSGRPEDAVDQGMSVSRRNAAASSGVVVLM